MMGLLAALLAFPITWALGGKLEPTPAGVFWLAAWFTVSAFIHVFVIAPFLVWRNADKEGAKKVPSAKLGSLAYQAMKSGIEIELDGSNKFNLTIALQNLNDDLVSYLADTELVINGVEVIKVSAARPNFVGPGQTATLIFTPRNVAIMPVNAMVGALNVLVRYKIRYALAGVPDTIERSTTKLISVEAKILMNGKNANSEILTHFIEEDES